MIDLRKENPYRNRRLLDLAKVAPMCFSCRARNDGTLVPAHANLASMGKAARRKAADVVAFVCHHCHDLIDGRIRVLSKDQQTYKWALAATHSMRWALERHPEVFGKQDATAVLGAKRSPSRSEKNK